MKKGILFIVLGALIVGGLVSVSGAATVLETKPKNLPEAGTVVATTSFSADVIPGPGIFTTVCIVITPVDPLVEIIDVEHKKTTARGTADLSSIEINPAGTMLCVDVEATGAKVKTVHLKAIVSNDGGITEEGIGVNIHY